MTSVHKTLTTYYKKKLLHKKEKIFKLISYNNLSFEIYKNFTYRIDKLKSIFHTMTLLTKLKIILKEFATLHAGEVAGNG